MKTPLFHPFRVLLNRQACAAFTRLDLLAVLLALACVVPLVASNPQGAQSAICLNNMKKLAFAMNLYAADHSDLLPPNPGDYNTIPGHNWCVGSMKDPNDATNRINLTDRRYNLLAPYTGSNYRFYKCPADWKMIMSDGKSYPTVRSVSMSQAVGTICPGSDSSVRHSGVPNRSVNGLNLNGMGSHQRDMPYRCFGKASDFYRPSLTWMFIDEDPSSTIDGSFAFSVAEPYWIEFPGTYHDLGAGLAFADGHSEIHRWQVASTRQIGNVDHKPVADDPRDWQWLADRTTQKALAK